MALSLFGFGAGLGSLGVVDLLSMSEDGAGGRGEPPGAPPLVKSELPPLIPSKPSLAAVSAASGLLGLAADSSEHSAADKMQAAMAMAAFYSQQSNIWQAAVAAREVQAARDIEAVRQHNSLSAAGLNYRPPLPPPLGAPGGFPGLPGLAALGGSPAVNRNADLYRDYLSKLAASSLSGSQTSPTASYSSLLSSQMAAAAINNGSPKVRHSTTASIDEKPIPATIRRNSSPGGAKDLLGGSTSSKRHSSPSSLTPYFSGSPYYNLKAFKHTSPDALIGGKGGKDRSPASSTEGDNISVGGESVRSGGRGRGRGRGSRGSTGGKSSSAAASINDRGDKVFTCPICHRSFGYKHVLQNHERTHTGEKPFECKECHKRFTRDHHLKTHMRLHTGEKPYSCTHCDRQFVQVANLRRHIRVHTGERPYKCELCPSNFSDSNQLKAHMLMHKGQSFKEELLRQSLAANAGWLHNPYTMSAAGLAGHHSVLGGLEHSLSAAHALGGGNGSSDLDRISPASKETTGGSSDTPSGADGENLSDTASEKKRSRKQKPRKISSHHQPWANNNGDDHGENNGNRSPSRHYETSAAGDYDRRRRRERHSSDFSGEHNPIQNEPEDLTMKPRLDMLRELQRRHEMLTASAAKISEEENDDSLVKDEGEEMEVDSYTDSSYRKENNSSEYPEFRSKNTTRSEGERSEGSSAQSPHSTPRRRSVGDDLAASSEDADRGGVSPPTTPLSAHHLGHHHHMTPPTALYNPLFANTAAFQLGLAGATMPLGHHLTPRFNTDKVLDAERLVQPSLVAAAAQKEISQQ